MAKTTTAILLAALAAAVLSASCARVRYDWTPYRSRDFPPRETPAVVAYEGDIPDLVEAGATLVGTLHVNGNARASRRGITQRAAKRAAQLGGSHIILTGHGSTAVRVWTSPGQASTSFYGDTATTTYTPPQDIYGDAPHASFLVVRVHEDNLLSLPSGLRK